MKPQPRLSPPSRTQLRSDASGACNEPPKKPLRSPEPFLRAPQAWGVCRRPPPPPHPHLGRRLSRADAQPRPPPPASTAAAKCVFKFKRWRPGHRTERWEWAGLLERRRDARGSVAQEASHPPPEAAFKSGGGSPNAGRPMGGGAGGGAGKRRVELIPRGWARYGGSGLGHSSGDAGNPATAPRGGRRPRHTAPRLAEDGSRNGGASVEQDGTYVSRGAFKGRRPHPAEGHLSRCRT